MTYNNTIAAGDSGATACVSRADTDDGDGAASDTQQNVQVTDVNADRFEDGGTSNGVGLRNIFVSIRGLADTRTRMRGLLGWCYRSRRW